MIKNLCNQLRKLLNPNTSNKGEQNLSRYCMQGVEFDPINKIYKNKNKRHVMDRIKTWLGLSSLSRPNIVLRHNRIFNFIL